MTVTFICGDPPYYGLQSGPVLLRHLVRLQERHRVVCCHYNQQLRELPYASERIPLRKWWFVPVMGSRLLLRINLLCKALYLRRRLRLARGDVVLVCVHTSEHHLARLLARLSGARLVALVHDHWAADADVLPTFRSADSVLCVSDTLCTEVLRLGARSAEVLPPICEDFLGNGVALSATAGAPCLGIAGSIDRAYVEAALRFGMPVVCLGSLPDSTLPGSLAEGAVPGKSLRCLPRLEHNRDALLTLATQCTALLVHQSASMASYSRYSFPSKLLDFVQTGLPVIICAPADSPVGRWAAARGWRLYLEDSADAVACARIRSLLEDPATYAEEATRSRTVAQGEFSPAVLHAQLERGLRPA